MPAKQQRMSIEQRGDVTILDLGRIEIWDGADLALLRETLTRHIERRRCRSIGVNMRYVKYIPGGYFGMLHDWRERGIAVRLYSPQPNVQMMLWFRQFCEHEGEGCFALRAEPKQQLRLPGQPTWKEPVWTVTEVVPMAAEPEPQLVEADDQDWLN
jgi:hypothetical protein